MPANGYTEESLIGEANAQGVSILLACCQCGGGLEGKWFENVIQIQATVRSNSCEIQH